MLGKIESRRRGQEDEMLDGITDSMDISLSKLGEMLKDRNLSFSPWGHKESDTT